MRGAIVTHNGQILPPAPRPAPPPVPPPTTAKDAGKEETKAITPWQKATREVATVTTGMGAALALGKATGPAFMDNVFTFGLAGLIGYRVVWGVTPALHSPLMSVTNAISGMHDVVATSSLLILIIHSHRNGWHWRSVRHGRWLLTWNNPTSTRRALCSSCVCQRFRRFRHYETYAGHVQEYVALALSLFAPDLTSSFQQGRQTHRNIRCYMQSLLSYSLEATSLRQALAWPVLFKRDI